MSKGEWTTNLSFRYTCSFLQCTLQLMGCKPCHSFKISKRVLEVIRDKNFSNGIYLEKNKYPFSNLHKSSVSETDGLIDGYLMEGQADKESCYRWLLLLRWEIGNFVYIVLQWRKSIWRIRWEIGREGATHPLIEGYWR